MINELIKKAQMDNEDAMMELIRKFHPLLKKYAVKLNYEDAYEDNILYFIELIKNFDLNKLICPKDEIIVSYINISIINFYNKKIRKFMELKKEILLSDLTKEQIYYVEAQLAREDKTDIFIEFGIKDLLNKKESQIIYFIYVEGYSTAELARVLNKSRQAVNQLKRRALKKIKNISEENLN